MDKQNLNIFLKFLEESGSNMNNINSFLNNLQNNDIIKFKNIFIGKELYYKIGDLYYQGIGGNPSMNEFYLLGDINVAKNNYEFVTLKDNDYAKPFILIVEDKTIIDILSFTEFDKYFIHFPNTLKFILFEDSYKLKISYTNISGNKNESNLKNFIVVNFNKITINFLDLSNLCNKYIKL